MSRQFLSDLDVTAELVKGMPEEDQRRYAGYGHLRVEGAFVDRIFIVYKPTGLNAARQHREPHVLGTIKVIDFGVDPHSGSYAVVRDSQLGQELRLTHTPKQLYKYPVYMSLPPRMQLRWDARHVADGVAWSLSFALLVKAKNRANFYSKGNVYVETPASFREMYPNVTGGFQF